MQDRRTGTGMGKIYYVMGKSASGKDTIYKRLLAERRRLKRLVPYTTRPKREGEEEGVEYRFTTPEVLRKYAAEKKLIEMRTYQTEDGPWSYATVDDGSVDLSGKNDYLGIGTLESYRKLKDYYGEASVVPVFIALDPGIRLQRALNRENMQKQPRYKEMCRRFLADEEDFSEDRLYEAGIRKRYVNEDLGKCLAAIMEDMI
jgi:guanylate kinase